MVVSIIVFKTQTASDFILQVYNYISMIYIWSDSVILLCFCPKNLNILPEKWLVHRIWGGGGGGGGAAAPTARTPTFIQF